MSKESFSETQFDEITDPAEVARLHAIAAQYGFAIKPSNKSLEAASVKSLPTARETEQAD